ncbi:hypothetical protein G6F43_007063 [Rhizopus delemar]|nr:hypothetical protein G6F43_007063 [Rhizopus delemar]
MTFNPFDLFYSITVITLDYSCNYIYSRISRVLPLKKPVEENRELKDESASKESDRIVSQNRQRHSSISSCPTNDTPLILSPSTSTSSLWSLDSNRSRVEEMIYLFETGNHLQKRRYSMDACYPTFIRERKFEYLPTVNEWRKRENSTTFPPIRLSTSNSTPVRRLKKNFS